MLELQKLFRSATCPNRRNLENFHVKNSLCLVEKPDKHKHMNMKVEIVSGDRHMSPGYCDLFKNKPARRRLEKIFANCFAFRSITEIPYLKYAAKPNCWHRWHTRLIILFIIFVRSLLASLSSGTIGTIGSKLRSWIVLQILSSLFTRIDGEIPPRCFLPQHAASYRTLYSCQPKCGQGP